MAGLIITQEETKTHPSAPCQHRSKAASLVQALSFFPSYPSVSRLHSLDRAVSANFQSDPISCQQTNVSRKCNTLAGRVYYQHLEPGKLHIFSSTAGNFIVCTSKEGLKGLPLKAGPAQVSALFWSLQKKTQRRWGGSTLKLPPMFSTKEDSPALCGAKL